MTTPGLAGLQAKVRADLAELLPRRRAARRGTVLGAGRDDLEPGRRWLHLLAPGGWATPGWPVVHGGMGLGDTEAEAVREVVAEFEAPDLYPFLVGVELVGPTLLAHATDDQARRWLPGIRTGDEVWCQLFSEPDAGSDLANVSSRAVRDGDVWRLRGSKVWTSRGHYADRGLLLARTDGSVPKHRGITAFGLDMRSPGVTVRPLRQMNGDAHFSEVFFDDVDIPDGDRIGAPGEGWRVAITCLSHERGSLAGGLGVTAEQLLALGATPGVAASPVRRDRLARAVADLRLIQLGAQRAAESRRAGHLPGPEGSLAKLASNALVRDVAGLGLESEGPAATLAGGGAGEVAGEPDEWQSMWLVSPSLSIRGGTDEIQRNIIGERALGLPPEPRVDKDRPFDERS